MKIELWSNVNGWHWDGEASDFNISSAKSYETREKAERAARRVCTKLGIKLRRVFVDPLCQ